MAFVLSFSTFVCLNKRLPSKICLNAISTHKTYLSKSIIASARLLALS